MDIAKYYSLLANHYKKQNLGTLYFLPDLVKDIFSSYPVGSQVLDAGCGPGVEVPIAEEKGLHITGLDFAPQMIAEFKKAHPHLPAFLGSMVDFSFNENYFDGIVAFFSLIHLSDEEFLSALKNFRSCCKKDGKINMLIGTTQDSQILNYTHQEAEGLDFLQPISFYFRSEKITQKLIEEAGWTHISWKMRKNIAGIAPRIDWIESTNS